MRTVWEGKDSGYQVPDTGGNNNERLKNRRDRIAMEVKKYHPATFNFLFGFLTEEKSLFKKRLLVQIQNCFFKKR